mmetsp:Transcript_19288/g.29304  ORF Transcript_19288/g.29304 Transcript_19288/m.29304 type:complete len:239 (+) Transcript_19288:140-856(+)|eukprot:CAMPEP_0118688082 /NCGR_PEP_ID=MMETSP0800-20121206/8729_1 /TAXON_ID=210618 ORGANISM="Striatella unipunctata, Strain CCMP2910" /NCGR_SAMPLE_ID=MMETSP0800 /ASSEMBLY_ACC=CAM_ASM_000638 /LENGTH=238 /DNA_ID=CAMNT_0006585315 /DNA_START=66 /DNA_END=782 /DNA_ORIENTATION=+
MASKSGKAASPLQAAPLYVSFPVNSVVEVTLTPSKEVVRGLVYCTDEISRSVVLQERNGTTGGGGGAAVTESSSSSSPSTADMRIFHDHSIASLKIIRTATNPKKGAGATTTTTTTTSEDSSSATTKDFIGAPLPTVTKKALEEREKRAIRLAEESFTHINEKATPEGQATFDRLLKACNQVVWRGESILVLNQVRVDPPYGKDHCKLIQATEGKDSTGLSKSSLERVKRIVSSEPCT